MKEKFITKKCKVCQVIMKLKAFSLNNTIKGKKYYKHICKTCNSKKSVQWAKKNPERNRAKALRYYIKKFNN